MLGFFYKKFLQKETFRITLAIVAGFIHNVCTVLLLLSIGKYIELAFNGSGNKSRALQWIGIQLPNSLTVFFMFFFGIIFLKLFAAWAEKYYTKAASLSFTETLRASYFQHLLTNNKAWNGKPASKLLVWFSSDLKAIQRLAEKGLIGLIKDGLFLVLCLYLLFKLSIDFAFIIFIIVVTGWTVTRYSNQKGKQKLKKSRDAGAGVLAHISEVLSKAETSSETLNIIREQERLEQLQAKMLHTKQTHLLRSTVYTAMVPFLMYLLLGMIMIIAAFTSVITLSPADVLTFLLLLLNLFGPMGRIIRIENTLTPGKISLQKLTFLNKTNLLKNDAEKAAEVEQENEFSVN